MTAWGLGETDTEVWTVHRWPQLRNQHPGSGTVLREVCKHFTGRSSKPPVSFFADLEQNGASVTSPSLEQRACDSRTGTLGLSEGAGNVSLGERQQVRMPAIS